MVMQSFEHDATKPPLIFIIGTGRSGTTILQEILGAQKSIGYPAGEQDWIWHPKLYPYTKRRVESPMYQVDPHRFVEISRATRSWFEQARIDMMIWAMKIYYRGKPVLLKSPMLSFNAEEIFYRYKNVKFLAIHRNKDKVIDSWVRKDYGRKYEGIFDESTYREVVANYIDLTDAHLDKPFFHDLEEKGLLLRIEFESFIVRPEEHLAKISDFFGVA